MRYLFSTFIPDEWKHETWLFWEMRQTHRLLKAYLNIELAYRLAKIEMRIYRFRLNGRWS